MILSIIFALVFGAVYGSFLNVLLWRLPEGKSIGGRSRCRSCGTTLAWYDLIPIFSFLALGAKCRNCGRPISARYLIVETTSAVVLALFVGIGRSDFSPAVALSAVAVLVFVSVFFFDLLYFSIPDALTISAAAVFLAYDWYRGDYPAILAGLLLAAFFGILYWASGETWLGLGDVKLSLLAGFVLGYPLGVEAVIVAIWAGAAVGLILMAGKKAGAKTPLPFGAFLSAAAIILLIFGNVFTFFQPIFR